MPRDPSPGTAYSSRRRHADRPPPPGGQDELDDQDDLETERGDPTFGLPVPKGGIDVPPVDADEPVQYGGDAADQARPRSTYDPGDEDDDSQAV